MANTYSFQLITPEGVALHENVVEVTLPTKAGEIGILANHTPIVSLLKPGEMKVKKSDHEMALAVGKGFVEVRKGGEVIILTDMAERAEEIDVKSAKDARDRAEQLLKEKSEQKDVDFASFEATFERELARFKVADKYSRK